MEELNKTNTIGCKPWKKALSVLLSIIIAFGTFVTITFGNSRFQKWLGIQDMLSAYAAEMVDTKGAIAVDEEAMLANDHTINLENKDGSNTVYLFSEPISYTDEDGKLKTKDISVEKQTNKELKNKGYEYTNGQNDYRINFSTDSNTGLYIEFDNSSYSVIPQSDNAVTGKESTSEILGEGFEDFEYKNNSLLSTADALICNYTSTSKGKEMCILTKSPPYWKGGTPCVKRKPTPSTAWPACC